MIFDYLKEAFTGVIVGVIVGPLVGGILGFLLLSVTWWVQGLIWPAYIQEEIILLAATFGILVAPIAAGIGAIVGLLIGVLGRIVFGSRVAAGFFGGFIGAFLGALASLGLFGGENGDLLTVFVGLFALAFTGVAVGALVKYVQLRTGREELVT